MAALKSDFLRAVTARGQFHQCTDLEGLDQAAAKGVTGYIGFDMTAPSLHVGNLTQIMFLRRLQQAGGKPWQAPARQPRACHRAHGARRMA